MKTTELDLLAALSALSDPEREDFLEFLGGSGGINHDRKKVEDDLSLAIALREAVRGSLKN